MSIEIKTVDFVPKRFTYGHIARRLGADKPASRYQEGIYDLQATANFHYKPLYEPDFELYEEGKTKTTMEDWYKATDPRQYYYATYNFARAAMQASTEKNFEFVRNKGLLEKLPELTKGKIEKSLIPIRHLHWGCNMNMSEICQRGYGSAITAPCIFSAMDHLGMAQNISQIGFELDGKTGVVLDQGKDIWVEDPAWQGIRKLIEDTFVERDWVELYVAQTLIVNGLVLEYVYNSTDAYWDEASVPVAMLTEFSTDWLKEEARWSDNVIKVIAGETVENMALVNKWVKKWSKQAFEALEVYAESTDDTNHAKLNALKENFNKRLSKLKLEEV